MKKAIIFSVLIAFIAAHISAEIHYYEDTERVGLITVTTTFYFSDKDDKDAMYQEFLTLKNKNIGVASAITQATTDAGDIYLSGFYRNSVFYQVAGTWFYNTYQRSGSVIIHKRSRPTSALMCIYDNKFITFNAMYDDYEQQCEKYLTQ